MDLGGKICQAEGIIKNLTNVKINQKIVHSKKYSTHKRGIPWDISSKQNIVYNIYSFLTGDHLQEKEIPVTY